MLTRRGFFLGAGASCADGFPLTRDIVYGLADAICFAPGIYERPRRFLNKVFRVPDADLKHGAAYWQEFIQSPETALRKHVDVLLPDIVELLSLLDVLIADESLITGEKHSGDGKFRPFSPRELSRVRESVSRAVASAFFKLDRSRSPASDQGTTRSFVRSLKRHDVVVTTNWDLLLDRSLHERFETDASSVGSDVSIVDEWGQTVADRQEMLVRPPLFKLHGSLNWLTCHRCTRLYVNPTLYIAELGFLRHGNANTCHCSMPLSGLLITPTYFKQYRNRHLINIWARAQQELVSCDEWYFVGYSLPTDDVHIRAFLLRALHQRLDSGAKPPRVIIVTKGKDPEMTTRYKRLFRTIEPYTHGFTAFIDTLSHTRGKVDDE